MTTAKTVIDRNRQRRFGGANTYSYPSSAGVHSIVLVFKNYEYDTERLSRRTRATVASVGNTVVLPLPTNLTDTYNVQVGSYELGGVGALAADLASRGSVGDAITGTKDALVREGQNVANDIINGNFSGLYSNFQAATAFGMRNFLDALPVGGINQGLSVGTGRAVNPHIALTFDGVGLKSHQFNWNLSPRNAQEAETIKNIIDCIKKAMLPSYWKDNSDNAFRRALLEYPDIVEIFFTGVNPNYLFHFKPALIQDFTVDYAPNGIALNRGGKPSFINMSLSLTEATIHTREDV